MHNQPEALTGRARAQHIARHPYLACPQNRIVDNFRQTTPILITGRAPVHSRGLLSQSTSLYSCLCGLSSARQSARAAWSRPRSYSFMPKGYLHTILDLIKLAAINMDLFGGNLSKRSIVLFSFHFYRYKQRLYRYLRRM